MCLYASVPLADATSSDVQRQLRELRPTASNIGDLRSMMDATRQQRRHWIEREHPDATTVLRQWPRLFDVNEVVCTL